MMLNHNDVNILMGDLEDFLHNKDLAIVHLIKIAIIHYQFETIHPFLDGNGRIGRLLITLYLVSNNLLDKPSLYLSDFFERNKGLYYEKLTLVRQTNDLSDWIKFFLTGVIETSQKSIDTFKNIMQLKEQIDIKLYSFGKKSENANKLVNYLYAKPMVDAVAVMNILDVSKPTAISLLKDFEKHNILKEITGFQRNKIYLFEEYINIFT